jgi:hypothetical protein
MKSNSQEIQKPPRTTVGAFRAGRGSLTQVLKSLEEMMMTEAPASKVVFI